MLKTQRTQQTTIATIKLSIMSTPGQYAHRAYWNDNRCAGEFVFAIQVSIPHAPCALVEPINRICETKSTSTLTSSEGTGCVKLDAFSDAPWVPEVSVGKPVPNANYLSLSQFNAPNCDSTGRTTEQNTFAANGNCYAVETNNSFFKATCDETQGSLSICRDAACTQCDSLLNAGTFQQRSISLAINQCSNSGSGSIRMTCLTPNQIQNLQSGSPTESSSTAATAATKTPKNNAISYSAIGGFLPFLLL
jgi:hypothetical protein